MSDYVLSCCSTCDLTPEMMKKYGLEYVPFHYELAGETYLDDLGQSLDYHEFYQSMADGADSKTSQVNPDEYVKYFTPFLEAGKDILHVSLSSGISGTVNSAVIAKEELEEKYKDRKIYVVDSLAASGGFGLLMMKLSELRDNGMSVDDLYKYAEEHKLNVHHWFFTSDLTYLIRGGRVSKASGMVGSLLNICPLLNVDFMGRLINRAKIRTKKKVIAETVERMVEHAENGLDYTGKVYITQADVYDDARAVADLIESKFTKMDGKVEISYIGPTIGAHTGPGTVALFFWGDKRID